MADRCVYKVDKVDSANALQLKPGDVICLECPPLHFCGEANKSIRIDVSDGKKVGFLMVTNQNPEGCGTCPENAKTGYIFITAPLKGEEREPITDPPPKSGWW